MLRVRDLIQHLQRLDQNARIVVSPDEMGPITYVDAPADHLRVIPVNIHYTQMCVFGEWKDVVVGSSVPTGEVAYELRLRW